MRILVTSDWHVDASTAGVERAAELESYVAALAARLEDTRKPRVDVLIHAGDFADPGSLYDCRWIATIMRHVAVLHRRVGRSIWIAGNHDVIETSGGWSMLTPLAEAAIAGWCEGIEIVEAPSLIGIDGVGFLCLPYVARSVEKAPKYRDFYTDALEEAGRRRKLVVVGHLSIPGITPGSEEEMPRGREMIFPVDEIAEFRPAVVINGHYHARQTFAARTSSGGNLPIEIPGAPIRFTFGERDDGARGWLEIEV